MDQLGILWPVLLFQIINFLLVFLLLKILLYEPILNLFDRRRERIREGLAEAERVREEAAAERARLEAQLNEERRLSQEKLRDAVARSEEAARRRLEEANTEAEGIIAKARSESEQVRRQALAGLQSEIAELTIRATSKVLESEIDGQRHRQLINRFLEDELGELA